MIPVYSTSAMANHLWQSTVFAGLAGLLAVLLRGNHAGTRYWLWLTASVKFLIPFSALAALGSRLGGLSGWLAMAPVARRPELSIVVEEISRPFPASPAAAASSILARHPGVLPGILLAVWIAGFVAVAFSWWRRWQRIRQAVRGAVPLDLEVAVPVLSSPAMLEPGVFGIFHPVLLLPEGIVDRLTPAHLEAIVAHVRERIADFKVPQYVALRAEPLRACCTSSTSKRRSAPACASSCEASAALASNRTGA